MTTVAERTGVTATTSTWTSVLAPDRRNAALVVAQDIADRLRNPTRVHAAAARALGQTSHPDAMRWNPSEIAHGFSGLALLWGYLDRVFPAARWDVVAHEHLALATDDAVRNGVGRPGLFAGGSGLAYAASYLSRDGRRYARLSAATDEALLRLIGGILDDDTDIHSGCDTAAFDVISGLAGIGAWLLTARARPGCAGMLDVVVRRLIAILGDDDHGIPRWHTPPHFLTDDAREHYPDGNLNCGLAHGLPGPLALLALVARCGVSADGLEETIERAARWLCDHRADDEWGINWPYAVPRLPAPSGGGITATPGAPSRSAWCYGSPGIARALWLAGDALDDAQFRRTAIEAIDAVLHRPIDERGIDSPSFCHGIAGLLQIVLRFANDTRDARFVAGARQLTEQLLALYHPRRLLGYQSLEYDGVAVDNPGLLDGASGVALVLVAAASDVDPAWDRIFLLS